MKEIYPPRSTRWWWNRCDTTSEITHIWTISREFGKPCPNQLDHRIQLHNIITDGGNVHYTSFATRHKSFRTITWRGDAVTNQSGAFGKLNPYELSTTIELSSEMTCAWLQTILWRTLSREVPYPPAPWCKGGPRPRPIKKREHAFKIAIRFIPMGGPLRSGNWTHCVSTSKPYNLDVHAQRGL